MFQNLSLTTLLQASSNNVMSIFGLRLDCKIISASKDKMYVGRFRIVMLPVANILPRQYALGALRML